MFFVERKKMNPKKVKFRKKCIIFYFENNVKMEVQPNGDRYWYKNDVLRRVNDDQELVYDFFK